jgi:hypothetical protein
VQLKTNVAIVGALAALTACASGVTPPRQEMEDARAAITQARPVAVKEAPAELMNAQEKLGQAEAAMQAKKYEQARTLAQQARADAHLAYTIAENARVKRQADEASAANQTLRQELERKGEPERKIQ